MAAECASGKQGIDAITTHKPDLVFPDICMRGMGGFATLDAISQRGFGVIFVTSHDEYAIRAMLPARLERLVNESREKGAPRTLVIPMRDGDRHLPVADIVRCEADRNYTLFQLKRGERVMSSRTLQAYAKFLSGNDLLRVHRSHFVNRAHITGVGAIDEVLLSDGSKVEISRRRLAEVMAALGR